LFINAFQHINSKHKLCQSNNVVRLCYYSFFKRKNLKIAPKKSIYKFYALYKCINDADGSFLKNTYTQNLNQIDVVAHHD